MIRKLPIFRDKLKMVSDDYFLGEILNCPDEEYSPARDEAVDIARYLRQSHFDEDLKLISEKVDRNTDYTFFQTDEKQTMEEQWLHFNGELSKYEKKYDDELPRDRFEDYMKKVSVEDEDVQKTLEEYGTPLLKEFNDYWIYSPAGMVKYLAIRCDSDKKAIKYFVWMIYSRIMSEMEQKYKKREQGRMFKFFSCKMSETRLIRNYFENRCCFRNKEDFIEHERLHEEHKKYTPEDKLEYDEYPTIYAKVCMENGIPESHLEGFELFLKLLIGESKFTLEDACVHFAYYKGEKYLLSRCV